MRFVSHWNTFAVYDGGLVDLDLAIAVLMAQFPRRRALVDEMRAAGVLTVRFW